jgi:DNA primase
MGIPDEEVAEVRAKTDIVALIGERAALKRVGQRWVGLCPFHTEKTPSFSVNAEEGFYYCFGCQKSGDAITFVRETEHLDFVEAVRRLADRAGITLHEDASGGREGARRRHLLDAIERATEWYHDRLLTGADAGGARDYLRSRGYDGEVVRRFRLGWAPDEWDALCVGLGLDQELATSTGLGFVNRRGRLQDAFRGRILFPICDPSDHPVALGGRVLPGSADPAKYKNSAETAVYSKRRTLYALNWAKHDVVATGEVVVCEGYTDVIGFFEAGVERAVATCGTALGEEHVNLLRNFARRVVLAFDADTAGQSAATRFYEWERRFEIDVAVADLPPGCDPAELAKEDPSALRAAVEGAKPYLRFRVDSLLAAADLSTAEGRAKAAAHGLEIVAEHPDDLVRDQYVMTLAERCHLEPERLRARLAELPRGPRDLRGGDDENRSGSRSSRRATEHRNGSSSGTVANGASGRQPRRSASREFLPGLEALRLAIHQPEEIDGRLEEVLFSDDRQRAAFSALAGANTLREAIDGAPADVAALLVRLTVEIPIEAADEVVHQLVREAVRREVFTLEAEARTSPQANEDAKQVFAWLHSLGLPDTSAEAEERLVAWLVVRSEAISEGQRA